MLIRLRILRFALQADTRPYSARHDRQHDRIRSSRPFARSDMFYGDVGGGEERAFAAIRRAAQARSSSRANIDIVAAAASRVVQPGDATTIACLSAGR